MIFAFSLGLASADPVPDKIIPLWPQGAPGAKGSNDADQPTLAYFPVKRAPKIQTAVIVCPGGGYVHLAMTYEGYDVAAWLNGHGITAFVLKYRLGPKYHYPVQLWDVQRAIRYVRSNAAELGFKTDRIGIWGFSAGGHLASTAGTHFDNGKAGNSDPVERQSSRPDFMILAYPVITLTDPYAHRGSRVALLGENPDPKLIELLSNEKQVTKETPPTFLFQTTEDQTVPVQNSVMFYLALRKEGIPVEMHLYLKGRHGVGLAPNDPVLHTWTERLADWLRAEDFME